MFWQRNEFKISCINTSYFFQKNLGAVCDEHGERFHQDITVVETRYKGKNNAGMTGDYCCFFTDTE